MHYVSLLMNYTFVNSPYKKLDLELLQSISDKHIFMDLYRLMTNKVSLNGKHHLKDAIIINETTIDGVRDLLLEKACCEYSLKSSNHEYDMDFISKLKLDTISEKIYNEIYYYLFSEKGINDPHHKEKLEKLLQGMLVERSSDVTNYLKHLEQQIDNCQNNDLPIITITSKPKSKILRLFTKKHSNNNSNKF